MPNPISSSEKCPECNSYLINREYPEGHPHYKGGVSEYVCSRELRIADIDLTGVVTEEEYKARVAEAQATVATCSYRRGAYCGEILSGNEVEPINCAGGDHPSVTTN